jgi:hypothetical protein
MKLTPCTLFFFIACTTLPAMIRAQSHAIQWREEPVVEAAIQKYQSALKERTKINGWRVQFYSTTDRRNLDQTIKQLKSRYPGVSFTWVYVEPIYQIRAGAFQFRRDTAPLQHMLKKEFAGAFPVQDEIEVLELLDNY